MRGLLTLSARRRAKWLVAGFWILVFFGLNGANIFEKYADAEKNRTVDYYPEKADSIQLLERIDEFPSGERFAAVVVYQRNGGLTAQDRAAIAEDRVELRRAATGGQPPPPVVSRDGTTALNVVPLEPTGEGDIVTRDVDRVREAIEDSPPGLQVEVTGSAGFAA
ncbi:MAG TPA: MMPL family transporter, partial [Thermoleophilaceae bacterium]|nr:MMPL family transporter [Thermoleophilaceae bacterium]